MKYRTRTYYTDSQKALMWERWKQGETLHQIAGLFDRHHGSIRQILAETGGIRPPERRRSRLALTLAEREEISRAAVAGFSIRAIATILGRAPSSVSREIKRNGGQGCYRATQADQAAWDRAHRPKRCKLAENQTLARIVTGKLQLQWSPEQIAGWLKHTYWNGRLLSLASAGCHSGSGRSCPAPTRRRQLMKIVTIGLDLAKNVFQVHGVDERGIAVLRKMDQACRAIADVPGIGKLTATALVAAMGDATMFKSGREFAAFLGLVPRQSGTGGKVRMGSISKRGDPYLRTLLIHGARSVMYHAKAPTPWQEQILARRPANVVAVALASKMARTAWAILARGQPYQRDFVSVRPA